MNTLLTKSALSAAIALTLVACGGSSGGLAGIGGSGFISSGTISGFGSVIVNGVKFETGSATFDVDGNLDGAEGDLAIGMVVNVSGSIDADGINGIATSISFDDELQGPVSALSVPDLDGITRTFIVLDTTVIINSGSTTFDISGENNVPPGAIFNFDTIADNNNVEISGFFNSAGNLLATRVELKNVAFDTNSIVEVKGNISNVINTTFTIGSLIIDASTAILDDLPNGLVDGQLVEVKGTFTIATNTINATKVEAEDDSVDDADEFELEGLITDFTDINTDFKVNGIPVNASNATFEPASLSSTLKDDLRVEVEGAIVNGILVATEIKLEDGNIKVHANIGTIDVPGNSFTLIPVSGQPPITVTVTTGTQFEDDVSASPSPTFNISDLAPGTFVEVEGHENDSSDGFTATEVEVKESDDIIVQGNLQNFVANTTIQILGVTFDVDFSGGAGETEFEDALDVEITQTEFDNATSPGDLVKIKDKNDGSGVLGTADEIEIETP